jgi:hypothetical protein
MGYGAATPEDLETLLEDTLVLENPAALTQLFEEGALIAVGRGHREVRGAEEISRLAGGIWTQENTYLAGLGRVMQARDLALVIAPGGVNLLRKGADGFWRYVILAVEQSNLTKGSTDEYEH